LFVDVIKEKVFSSMPPVKPKFNGEHIVRNLYLNLANNEYDMLVTGVRELGTAARYDNNTGGILHNMAVNFGGITSALVKIEKAKTGAIIRAANKILDGDYITFEPSTDIDVSLRNIKRKVIIYLSYKENLEKAYTELSLYDPIVLSGDVPKNRRAELIHQFQSDPEKRLLIIILQVGKVSISLDDQVGDSNRVAFAVPDYRLTDQYQAEGRIRRKNTMSTSEHNYVYGKREGEKEGIDILEKKIYNALAMKASTLSKVNSFEKHKSIKYPGEHHNVYEI
jgi:hypothetical protein